MSKSDNHNSYKRLSTRFNASRTQYWLVLALFIFLAISLGSVILLAVLVLIGIL
jgi:hypothetical protein